MRTDDTSLNILHTESSVGWGGQEIRILTEARGMMRRGHRVTLVTPPSADIFTAACDFGIPVVALPIVKKTARNLFAMRQWLAQHGRQFHVINSHSSTDSWLVALSRATLRAQPPVVRTRHVSTPVHAGAINNWLYRTAACHVVTTGEALRQQLHTENRIPLAHMTSVPTGIDLARFRPLDRAAARTRLGLPARYYAGILATLRDWKGHEPLLEVFARLRRQFSDWELVIIGDGPCHAHLHERIRALGLGACARLVGNQTNPEEWLNALDLFVLPSWGNEGVPQSIMQAMACGLPVVSTHVGAIGEAVVDGVTGTLVPARDNQALAAAVASFMADAGRRQKMGDAGLQHARAHFGEEPMLTKMEIIFRAAARPGGIVR